MKKLPLLVFLLITLIAIGRSHAFGKDPMGKTFTRDSLAKDGVVLVVTAPILRNKGAQEGWDIRESPIEK